MSDTVNEKEARGEEASDREATGRAKRAGRRGFCLGCIVAAIVIIGVVVAGLSVLFSSPEELVAYGQRTVGGPSTVEQAAAALRGVEPDVTLTLNDADVNAYIVEHRKELALPKGLKDPRVAFGDGFVEASVRTKVGFVVPVRVRIKVRPEVSEGRVLLQPIGGRAGKVGLPGGVRKKIARTAGHIIEQRLDAGGFDVKRVEVRKGELVVHGKLRPTDAGAPQ
jgi:hypothetical protein